MADRNSKLRLGGFVALSLAALTGLTVAFGGAPLVFSNKAKYVVLFGEAPSIAPGTPVRKSGVRIGEVTSLDLDEKNGQVRVSLQIDQKYLPRTTEDATIFRGILSGDTSVDFVPKTGADGLPIASRGEVLAPDTEIAGVTPINPNQLVRQATGALPNAQESIARMLASIQRFEAAIPKIERAFDEVGSLARSGRELVPELRRTNEKVQVLLAMDDGKPDGPEQPGLRAALGDLRDFVRATKPLIEDVRRLLKANEDDITGTLKAVRKSADGVNEMLNPENRKAVATILKNLEVSSDDLSKAIRIAAIVLDQGEKMIKNINERVTQSEKVLNTLETTLKSADEGVRSATAAAKNIEVASKPLADNAEAFSRNLAMASDQLAKALADARLTLGVINRSDGSFQKVLADPALYNNINESAAALTRTLQRAEKVAQDLQVFADKIARRPESLGIGGAVRPNSGLKESPAAPAGPGLSPSAILDVPAYKPPPINPSPLPRP